MSKFGRKIKEIPDGFDYIEPILTALDNELREKINEPHEGLRKTESQWPVHQINWQRSRYVYDMYYKYNKISREVYDYCITNKIVDAALIAKWKKNGYETLCSTYVINPKNFKFGTVSICRVPKKSIQDGTPVEDPTTGCLGCASGGIKNIFGNKYGQYLAGIQIAREERDALLELEDADDNDNEDEDEEVKEIVHTNEVVGAADGSSGEKPSIWSQSNDVDNELINSTVGNKNINKKFSGPPGKRTKNS